MLTCKLSMALVLPSSTGKDRICKLYRASLLPWTSVSCSTVAGMTGRQHTFAFLFLPELLRQATKRVICLNVWDIHHCRYEPAMQAADQAIDNELSNSGIEVHAMNTTLLHEPGDVRIAIGGRWVGHYGTLSPFLRSVLLPVNYQCRAVG